MVKPPKTMQPEAFDLSKAGRTSGKAFKDNTFHEYMARKIDLQRKQFGLVLPPPPPSTTRKVDTTNTNATTSKSESLSNQHKKKKRKIIRKTSPSPRKKPTTTTTSTDSPSKVRFSPLDIKKKAIRKANDNDDKTKKLDDDNCTAEGEGSMSSILQRLEKRHGKKFKRLGKRRRRRSSSNRNRNRSEVSDINAKTDSSTNEQSQRHPIFDVCNEEKPPKETMDETNPPKITLDETTLEINNKKDDSIGDNDDDNGGDELPSSSTSQSSPPPVSIKEIRQQRPDLFFLGIVVKVNGYTDPNNITLKRLLQKHGGDLETYETERVTHIIAENLSSAKADMYKRQKRPRPVCKPSWIVDSVREGRLLSHRDYILDILKPQNGQRTIHSLFAPNHRNDNETCKSVSNNKKRRHSSSHPERIEDTPQITKKQASDDDMNRKFSSSEKSEVSEEFLSMQKSSTQFPITQDRLNASKLTETSSVGEKNMILENSSNNENTDKGLLTIKSPRRDTGVENVVADCEGGSNIEERNAGDATQIGTGVTPASDDHGKKYSGKTDDKYINGKIRTVGTDPNFLETYFASSRLSFIGSYRQRSTVLANSPNKKKSINDLQQNSNNRSKRHRRIFHVDMDCFFAAVVLRNFPQYKNKPVVISHNGKRKNPPGGNSGAPTSSTTNSTSECATCNYKAREYGIKKGMFLGRARQLCSELIVLNYDFEGYEEVGEQVLEILYKVAAEFDGEVEAVSCDEAYLELFLDETNPDYAKNIAERIRLDIFEATQCTASIGVGDNKFLSKLGTDSVKPNGSLVVKEYKSLLRDLKLRDLHGIGWRSEPKLAAEGLIYVQDIWDCNGNAEGLLSRILGPALGKKIYDFCHGKDDRPVKAAERKTIGAECNYGVRFDGTYGIDYVIMGLAKEVQKRMEGVGVIGRHVTLKLKKRKEGAKSPPKFLGHGSCHNMSKSRTVPGSLPTRDAKTIRDVGLALFNELAVPLDDVRGIGIIVSKLSSSSGKGSSSSSNAGIKSWLSTSGMGEPAVDKDKDRDATSCPKERLGKSSSHGLIEPEQEGGCKGNTDLGYQRYGQTDECHGESSCSQASDDADEEENVAPPMAKPPSGAGDTLILPSLSQIRMSQVDALPDDIREEIRTTIKNASIKKAPKQTRDSGAIDLTGAANNIAESRTKEGKTSTKIGSSLKVGAAPAAATTTTCQGRFRQTDLKRLMKLAAVKSGTVETNISLTQLDNLPLEIKLQVVNEDNGPVGVLSQRKHVSRPSHVQTTSKKLSEPSRAWKSNTVEYNSHTDGSTHVGNFQAKSTAINDDTPAAETAERDDDEADNSHEQTGLLEGPDNLYEEDILPLQLFLDENNPSNHEAIEQVSEFLSTCIREGRFTDLTAIIRSIRGRKDEWSGKGVLETLAHSVDEEHVLVEGCHLDLDYIFGKLK